MFQLSYAYVAVEWFRMAENSVELVPSPRNSFRG